MRLSGVAPESIRDHAVQVNGVWYPVKQAFEIGVGVRRSEFISHTARRHLSTLGFPLREEIETRGSTPATVAAAPAQPERKVVRELADEEWHTEANVQAAVVTALAARGYRVLSVANTATKERGIDVVAALDGVTLGVEVKGFPSRNYADPARAGEQKKTAPSTTSRALVRLGRPRGNEVAWQGAKLAKCHRTSRLQPLPRSLQRNARDAGRVADRGVVDRRGWHGRARLKTDWVVLTGAMGERGLEVETTLVCACGWPRPDRWWPESSADGLDEVGLHG